MSLMQAPQRERSRQSVRTRQYCCSSQRLSLLKLCDLSPPQVITCNRQDCAGVDHAGEESFRSGAPTPAMPTCRLQTRRDASKTSCCKTRLHRDRDSQKLLERTSRTLTVADQKAPSTRMSQSANRAFSSTSSSKLWQVWLQTGQAFVLLPSSIPTTSAGPSNTQPAKSHACHVQLSFVFERG